MVSEVVKCMGGGAKNKRVHGHCCTWISWYIDTISHSYYTHKFHIRLYHAYWLDETICSVFAKGKHRVYTNELFLMNNASRPLLWFWMINTHSQWKNCAESETVGCHLALISWEISWKFLKIHPKQNKWKHTNLCIVNL